MKASEVNHLLIAINVLDSTRPFRFLAKEDDTVHKIIESALKLYAREGRLPILGFNIKQFELYCANGGTEGRVIPLFFFHLYCYCYYCILSNYIPFYLHPSQSISMHKTPSMREN